MHKIKKRMGIHRETLAWHARIEGSPPSPEANQEAPSTFVRNPAVGKPAAEVR